MGWNPQKRLVRYESTVDNESVAADPLTEILGLDVLIRLLEDMPVAEEAQTGDNDIDLDADVEYSP